MRTSKSKGHCKGRQYRAIAMLDVETVGLLRALLDELCINVPPYDASIRTDVACRLLAAAKLGQSSIDDLRRAGKEVLQRAADGRYT
jgi:hypothetical protein